MKKKEMKTKVMAVAMSATMAASICPAVPAVAATSSTDIAKIQDGTYTGTAKCIPDEYEEFDPYDLTVNVTVANGTITSISDISGNGVVIMKNTYRTLQMEPRRVLVLLLRF